MARKKKISRYRWVKCLILVFLVLLGLLFLSSPGSFNHDPQRIIQAIHQYHDRHGRWPDKLEQVKPQLLEGDVDLKSALRNYVYEHNNKMFILKYHEELEVGEYYRSDTKDYITMNYNPQDPGYISYEELDIKPVSIDIPLNSEELK